METITAPSVGSELAASPPLAAIDMGSNSFRLELGQLQDGRYRRIDYLKETVRLGAGLDESGLLDEAAAGRGLECLARFARRLEGFAPAQVRAVATQTLREARNRDAFLGRAEQALGHPIEIISGREEARLIYTGVARLQPSTLRRLVVDIGGRSTEMILGHGLWPILAESFQIGSVSLSMKYFPDGRFTRRGFHDAQVAAGAELEEALEPFAPGHWAEALGSSGTVGAVSQMLAATGVSDGRITPDGLRWLMARCLDAGSADRLDLPGLKDERRAVIGGGLAILYTLAAHFGIEELKPARGALRQGVIFDLEARSAAERLSGGEDLREQSVLELQRRFGVDVAQAARVAAVATSLLAAAEPAAAHESARELRWAAALHEAGMMVSHHDHHRHSAYLLAHVDAPGFSQNQLRRIGDLALGQRGGLRKMEAQLQDAGFALRLLCLRVAVIVCHARDDVAPHAVTLQQGGDAVTIGVDPDWAAAHPRALHLLREEVAGWAKVRNVARPPRLLAPEG
ncbi:MAG TPA: Ppx/GppA phosphatase family protein [Caldimonas sp.]|jgi:exopolyphosphatase/guanosine-5'-triphosphate,3'-diphosphate pyrophosphatase|nr:Ppx/GppA phosphatase family protein [Caldimonas sp.]HEX2539776.1 Ppx/GppA phosphatase family protein [Caldimonas sp.]